MSYIRVISKNIKNPNQLTIDDINKVEYIVLVEKLIIDTEYIKKNIKEYQSFNFNDISDLRSSKYIKSVQKVKKNYFCESDQLINEIKINFDFSFNDEVYYAIVYNEKDNITKEGTFYLYQNKIYKYSERNTLLKKLESVLIRFKEGYKKSINR